MKLKEAVTLFNARVAAGEVPDRRHPGRVHTISAGRRDVILSHARSAVARAAGIDRDAGAAIDEVELGPLMPTLTEHAYRSAREAGRSSPRNERTNVALFRATVEGEEYEITEKHGYANRRPVIPSAFLAEWRPLGEALMADAVNSDGTKNSRKSFPAQLLAMQNLLATRRGIRSPFDIPDDFHLFMTWAQEAGAAYKKRHAMLAALRRSREILNDPRIPTLYIGARAGERGLGSLPNVASLLVECGEEADPRNLRQEDFVRILAPTMHAALERHLVEGRRRNRRPGWFDDQVGMASRIAASAIRLGYDVKEMTFVDLWTRTVEVASHGPDGEPDQVLAAVMGSDYTHTEERSLMRVLADEMTQVSYRNSPIDVVGAAPQGAGEVTMYTARVIQDVKNAFVLVTRVFGRALQAHRRELWNNVVAEHRALLTHMKEYNEDLHTVNHKPKSSMPVLWPQAVCMFLPWLMRRVEAARLEIDMFFRRNGRDGSRTHRKHLIAFDEALKEYVLAALLLDDGLRIKNYAGALAGRHIIPTVEKDRDGRWLRITAVETHFRGIADHPSVVLKEAKDEMGAERDRRRQVTPGIVRYDYLLEFWTGTRARDLVRRGTIASAKEFDPDSTAYAFFISPRTGGRKSAKKVREAYAAQHGCFTEDHLSNIFGRRFNEFIREVMKVDVPTWDDPVRTKEWRGMFTAHTIRLMIGTHFGGVLKDWAAAEYLTDDTERTLRRHYSRVSDRIAALLHTKGPDNPRHFDAVIERALERRPTDNWPAFWAHFNPVRPAESLALLDTVSLEQRARHSRSRKGRSKRVRAA